MKLSSTLFVILFSFITDIAQAYSPIIFSKGQRNLAIGNEVYIFEDKNNALKMDDIMALSQNQFQKSTKIVPNLGVSNSSFWLKFYIKNTSTKPILLDLEDPILDLVEFYIVSGNKIIKSEKLGEYLPFGRRKFNHPDYIFELETANDSIYTYYLKLKSTEQILAPMTIGSTELILESLMNKNLIIGIYCGILIVMSLYNLFIYLSIGDKIYLYYVIYTFMVGLTQTTLQGYTFQYLWPNNQWLAMKSTFLLPAFVGFALIPFLNTFLQTRIHTPLLKKFLNALIVIYGIGILLALFNQYVISYRIIQANGLITSLALFYTSYIILRKGYKPAKFFLLGFSVFLLGVCIFALKDFGILPYNNFTNYTMQAGTALEVVLFSFALADRINILKKDKEKSQMEALNALQENERIIRQQNILLDIKVTERTKELQESNGNLKLTLQNLKETQSKLVDAEKMASLGQLTAGIAHEINNPINFVSSSVKPLKRDIDDIIKLLNKFEEVNIESNLSDKLHEIKTLKKQLDIDYVKEEINTLINGIDEGATRTAEIVKGLRNFSRLDERDLKLADLNEGINSTLALLKNGLKGRINIIKEFGNLPMVECYPGKLNQVFMNILNNAIQATTEKDDQGIITVTTIDEQNNVVIKIKDNGTGIPDSVKNKIFEPFFTTKDVGKGVGLGLSIVYNIIEAHQGQIKVESQEGKGTEFVIILPKFQKK
jgi:signal transduction histidine kinase